MHFVAPSAAKLVLEDGRTFTGTRFGARGGVVGEVVFNTSMTGYQEILSDPSYAGQIVVMTSPMMGNYGINSEDSESRRAFARGFIVREASRVVSNWRAHQSLGDYLAFHGIPGLYGLDTRALVRHLRSQGSMRGSIVDAHADEQEVVQRLKAQPSMEGADLASGVTTEKAYPWDKPSVGRTELPEPKRYQVVVYDFGVKHNILRRLVDEGCGVQVVPAHTSAEDVLALKPDGVLLSNGPGDPEPLDYAVHSVRALLGRVPIFGICLGHQILGLACGAKSYKLKFGHHGGNHPVQVLETGRVEITSHNHGFALDADSLPAGKVQATHVSLNDGTLEGLRLIDAPAFSVQYHPEAAPGPRDGRALFETFIKLMEQFKGVS